MSERSKKFLSYYRPYLKLFLADMFCAMIAAGITLVFPMIIRYITGTVLIADNFEMGIIYKLGIFMVVLVIIEYLCNYFVAYQGHVMGVLICVMNYFNIIKNYHLVFMMNKKRGN